MTTAPKTIAVTKALTRVMADDRGRLLAALVRKFGSFQAAEDALQEAGIQALKHWGRSGIPDNPQGWLLKVAGRKAIDALRKDTTRDTTAKSIAILQEDATEYDDMDTIPDERLRLIFTCCHPAIEYKSRVALTLRTVCGLTTRMIAAAFLDAEATMGQRISRAKTQITKKGIAFAVPEPHQWDARLDTVLTTQYLIFTTGYTREDALGETLCTEAIYLTRLLNQLRPEDPEIEGALALMVLTNARRSARIGADGVIAPTAHQDQTLWDMDAITEGQGILETAMSRGKAGPFQIKAAICDCHLSPDGPDWPQIALLYGALWDFEPTPVVALNWAVVAAELGYVDQAWERLAGLSDELQDFQPFHAACAHVLAKLGRTADAQAAYDRAIAGADNAADRLYLERAKADLS